MSRAFSDMEGTDTSAGKLPESVDRLLGIPSDEREPVVSVTMLDDLMARVDAEAHDSNIDRLAATREIDVLFDGTTATRVMVNALKRRLASPVAPNECIRISESR